MVQAQSPVPNHGSRVDHLFSPYLFFFCLFCRVHHTQNSDFATAHLTPAPRPFLKSSTTPYPLDDV